MLDATNYPAYILKGIQVEAKTMLNENIRTVRKNISQKEDVSFETELGSAVDVEIE